MSNSHNQRKKSHGESWWTLVCKAGENSHTKLIYELDFWTWIFVYFKIGFFQATQEVKIEFKIDKNQVQTDN